MWFKVYYQYILKIPRHQNMLRFRMCLEKVTHCVADQQFDYFLKFRFIVYSTIISFCKILIRKWEKNRKINIYSATAHINFTCTHEGLCIMYMVFKWMIYIIYVSCLKVNTTLKLKPGSWILLLLLFAGWDPTPPYFFWKIIRMDRK
jgi:hypothetical protein